MKVNFDEILITYSQKSVALKVGGDIVVDGILGEPMPFDKQLCVKFKFQHLE